MYSQWWGQMKEMNQGDWGTQDLAIRDLYHLYTGGRGSFGAAVSQKGIVKQRHNHCKNHSNEAETDQEIKYPEIFHTPNSTGSQRARDL